MSEEIAFGLSADFWRRIGYAVGLGLAIVKHALARHGSHLEVRSLEDQGAEFECRFDAGRIMQPADENGSRYRETALGRG